ncbi:MAG TPA: hypothetical protein VL240_10905 [Candidatus Binatia bacterium]|nr:hypothetical protein [Candidatus Binatia bacterium]
MSNLQLFSANRLRRTGCLAAILGLVAIFPACGSGGTPSTPTSNLKNRAFISNMFSGSLQIVDTQNDTTALTPQTTNSAGQLIPGQPVTIAVAATVTFEVESPDHSVTMVYDPSAATLWFVTNSTEMTAGNVSLTSSTGMALFSSDGNSAYAPEPNLLVAGATRAGGVQVVSRTSLTITAAYAVPSARYIALSPNGQFLLVFADNSDSVFLINLNASTVTPVEIPGFARPINAFFSSDNNTAYVLNCGPECGSSGPASVASLDIPSQTITATVPVGGASVGLLNGTTLYVAGSPVPPGTTSTYDAVNVSNMTRLTSNSVAIGDGFHTTMALANNNKLYIGASSCRNRTTGCLSVVDVTNNTADPALPPGGGAITSLLAVKNRNVMYAIEGGLLHIYNTTNDTLQPNQLTFTGALSGIVQVDP